LGLTRLPEGGVVLDRIVLDRRVHLYVHEGLEALWGYELTLLTARAQVPHTTPCKTRHIYNYPVCVLQKGVCIYIYKQHTTKESCAYMMVNESGP
jgi:hypothetical protein